MIDIDELMIGQEIIWLGSNADNGYGQRPVPYSEDWFKEEEERMMQNILDKNEENKRDQAMLFGEDY